MKRPLLVSSTLQNSAVSSKSRKLSTLRRNPCGHVCFESPVGVIGCNAGSADIAPSTTLHFTPPMVVHPFSVLPSKSETQPSCPCSGHPNTTMVTNVNRNASEVICGLQLFRRRNAASDCFVRSSRPPGIGLPLEHVACEARDIDDAGRR